MAWKRLRIVLTMASLVAGALVPTDASAQGAISGNVTGGGAALTGVEVRIFNSSESFVGSTTTSGGGYTVSGLAPGTYYAFAFVPSSGVTPAGDFVNALYSGVNCVGAPQQAGTYCRVNSGTPITVTSGVTSTANINLPIGGKISGKVTAGGVGYAQTPVELHVDNGASTSRRLTAGTAVDGTYEFTRLPAGTYFVWGGNPSGGPPSGHIAELHGDVACPSVGSSSVSIPTTGPGCSTANATATTVALGATATADLDLASGGAIAGNVRGDSGAFPPGVFGSAVNVWDASGRLLGTTLSSAVSGDYAARGLPAGQYRIHVSRSGYRSELYDDVSCPSGDCFSVLGTGTPVTVAVGATTTGRDFALALGRPGIEVAPVSVAVVSGMSTTLSVKANGAAPLAYQWYQGTCCDTTNPVPGASSETFTTPAIVSATQYWVSVSNAEGMTGSGAATVSVSTPGTGAIRGRAIGGGQPTMNALVQVFNLSEQQVQSTRTAADGTYGVGNLAPGAYYVFVNSSGVYGLGAYSVLYPNIPCAGNARAGGTYCRIYTGTPITVTANTVTPGIDLDMPAAGAISGSITAQGGLPVAGVVALIVDVPGQSTTAIGASSDARGNYLLTGIPPGQYRLQANAAGMTPEVWDDIACPSSGCLFSGGVPISVGGTPITVASGATTTGKHFDLAPLRPVIVSSPVDAFVASGRPATLNVRATGEPPLVYRWYEGAVGDTTHPVGGGTSGTLTTAALSATTNFWARVTNRNGQADSLAAAVHVGAVPTIATQPVGATVNEGQVATLTVVAAGTSPFTYQWHEGASGDTTKPITGATTASFDTPVSLTGARSYWVRVSSPFGTVDSSAVTVTALPNVGAPQGLHVRAIVGNRVTIAWRGSPGQFPVTGHVLEGGLPGSTAPLATIATGSALTTFTIALPNGAFWLQMRAVSGASASAASPQMPICLNANCPPLAPVNLLSLADGAALSLAWRTPLESGIPTRIRLSVSGSVNAAVDLPGTTESFAVPGIPAGSYDFAVAACTSAGCSTPTATAPLAFPGTCTAPEPPAGFMAGATGATLFIDWGLPASGTPPSSYRLNVTSAVFTGSVPFAGRGFSSAVPSGAYTLSVVAVNACGTSAATTPITVTVP